MSDTTSAHHSIWRSSEAIDIAYAALGVVLQLAVPLAPARDYPIARYIAGALALAASVALIVATQRAFRAHGQSPKPGKEITHLIDTGPFAYSRNPMYVASAVLFVALALLFANYWFALLLPALIVAFNVWMIAPEERFMQARFGAEWDAYRARVRRWI